MTVGLATFVAVFTTVSVPLIDELEASKILPEPKKSYTPPITKAGVIFFTSSEDSISRNATPYLSRPNFTEMPALIMSAHASLTSLTPNILQSPAFKSAVAPEASRKLSQFIEKSRQNMTRTQNNSVTFSNDNHCKSYAGGSREFGKRIPGREVGIDDVDLPKKIEGRNELLDAAIRNSLKIDDNISVQLSYPEKQLPTEINGNIMSQLVRDRPRTSVIIESDVEPFTKSMQVLMDEIAGPETLKIKKKLALTNAGNYSETSLTKLKTVKRRQSSRPAYPGGHHTELLASRNLLMISSHSSHSCYAEASDTTLSEESHSDVAGAWDILKSPVFWLYASTCILQQGTTYMTNIATILQSLYGQSSMIDQHQQCLDLAYLAIIWNLST
ncbi:hypothetical protein HK100_002897 [Physocladia obscura]|uniref:Uncharacterized protein n=1 Tax=Physocladia obscura TaxID=109957 RepID=A0AAD5SUT1_9FUNG|nr:hypothetical protein HK100_002897 [Physocladia obscura]